MQLDLVVDRGDVLEVGDGGVRDVGYWGAGGDRRSRAVLQRSPLAENSGDIGFEMRKTRCADNDAGYAGLAGDIA